MSSAGTVAIHGTHVWPRDGMGTTSPKCGRWDTNVSGESTVILQIGAQHSQVRLARLVAAGIAALEAFDVEAVEDFRISVDEGCVWLIDQGDGSPLTLEFAVRPGGIVEVSGETTRRDAAVNGSLGELAAQILSASCAEHRFESDGPRARFALTARASSFGGGVPLSGEGRS